MFIFLLHINSILLFIGKSASFFPQWCPQASIRSSELSNIKWVWIFVAVLYFDERNQNLVTELWTRPCSVSSARIPREPVFIVFQDLSAFQHVKWWQIYRIVLFFAVDLKQKNSLFTLFWKFLQKLQHILLDLNRSSNVQGSLKVLWIVLSFLQGFYLDFFFPTWKTCVSVRVRKSSILKLFFFPLEREDTFTFKLKIYPLFFQKDFYSWN